MSSTFKLLIFLAFLMVFAVKCKTSASSSVNADIDLVPHKKLSDYNFFRGKMADLLPNDRVLPYDLHNQLFTDYAHKARFVWLPDGTSAVYSDSEAFDFPVGAVLIKNFFYPLDFRDENHGKNILETRLLVHRQKGWEAYTYVWNDEQTEAFFEVAGGIKNVSWIDDEGKQVQLAYSIPNKNQCKSCHDVSNKLMPVGPKAWNLNKVFNYVDGEENQLVRWAQVGYLQNLPQPQNIPASVSYHDASSGSLEARARSMLDINCGHCHNPKGSASQSGMFLNLAEENLTALGLCKSPVAAGRGSGGSLYGIFPGKPGESIMVHRMESTEPGIMMPEIGRRMVHKEAVQLVREWITSMEGSCN